MCQSCPALRQQTRDWVSSSRDIESASHVRNCYRGKYIFPLAPLSDTLKPWKMPQKISHTLLCSFHLFQLFSALQVLYQHRLYKGISLLLITIADIITAEGLLGAFISEQWTMGRGQCVIRGLSTYLLRYLVKFWGPIACLYLNHNSTWP